jgi:hypothetical protein
VIELWRGNFADRSNEEKFVGELNGVDEIEVFNSAVNK